MLQQMPMFPQNQPPPMNFPAAVPTCEPGMPPLPAPVLAPATCEEPTDPRVHPRSSGGLRYQPYPSGGSLPQPPQPEGCGVLAPQMPAAPLAAAGSGPSKLGVEDEER